MRLSAIFLLFTAAFAVSRGEDWTATDGKTYKNVKVISHDAYTVVILDEDGGGTLPLSNLSPEIQKRFGYIDRAAAEDNNASRSSPFPQSTTPIEATPSSQEIPSPASKPVAPKPTVPFAYLKGEAQKERARLDDAEQVFRADLETEARKEISACSDLWFARSIKGQVFITTRGGDNIKLGGITIGLLSEKTVNEWVSGVNHLTEDEISNLKALSKFDTSVTMESTLREIANDRWNSCDKYSAFTPTYALKVKTDADGKFEINIPRWSGSYFLSAKGSRLTGEDRESYLWIVKIPSGAKNIQLDNNNMVSDTLSVGSLD